MLFRGSAERALQQPEDTLVFGLLSAEDLLTADTNRKEHVGRTVKDLNQSSSGESPITIRSL